MIYKGNIIKMRVENDSTVIYYLPVGEKEILMNDILEKRILIKYLGKINCIKCGRETKTSFAQGYCYPCFISAPETEECVIRPELCRAHEGIARDMEFAKGHCLISHIVYIAVSSDIKVGVTRQTQIPVRWIDQGASHAIKLARTPNRYLAGIIEVSLKKVLQDKTNWRHMLTGRIIETFNLIKEKEIAKSSLTGDLRKYFDEDNEIFSFNYPVKQYPEKVKSINLDKSPEFAGELSGIKGQYLIFKDGNVINIRKYGGYLIRIEV
ncbi:MAG: DUF2797 domain-containing protein [Bacteroidales bacterium]|nr:MAG: DUF2797 domain-containing protein [Bacteroidales bacterium]